MQRREQTSPGPHLAVRGEQFKIQTFARENLHEGSEDSNKNGSIHFTLISETPKAKPCV